MGARPAPPGPAPPSPGGSERGGRPRRWSRGLVPDRGGRRFWAHPGAATPAPVAVCSSRDDEREERPQPQPGSSTEHGERFPRAGVPSCHTGPGLVAVLGVVPVLCIDLNTPSAFFLPPSFLGLAWSRASLAKASDEVTVGLTQVWECHLLRLTRQNCPSVAHIHPRSSKLLASLPASSVLWLFPQPKKYPPAPFIRFCFLLCHLEEQVSEESNEKYPGLSFLTCFLLLQKTGLHPKS